MKSVYKLKKRNNSGLKSWNNIQFMNTSIQCPNHSSKSNKQQQYKNNK